VIGKTISHYKILEKLGEGGMGVVYKAQDLKLDRVVALKFLPQQMLNNESEKVRFIREAQAAAVLNHPNIATVYEIDEADGQIFIAMEYLEGKTLKERIEAKPFRLTEAIDIAVQVAQGIHVAHEKDIVHRDIKTSNIMVTEKGQAKVMDFGLAKLKKESLVLTKQGTTLGTIAYMSPEQARAETVDRRTDIWSLGIVLYEMIAGRLPFRGEFEQAIIYSVLNEDQEPLTALRSDVPIALESIVNKCLMKNAAKRYQHADELIVDLQRVKNESVTLTSTVRSGVKPKLGSKQRAAVAFGGIFIVAAIAVTILIVRPTGNSAGNLPVVILMDSPIPERVYDPETRKNKGTNADDITDLLQDLPVAIHKETTSSHWHREDQVLRQDPALIVIHRSCFFDPTNLQDTTFRQELYQLLESKLISFLGYIALGNPRTRFLVYSRGFEDAETWIPQVDERFPPLKGRIVAVHVPGKEKATFRDPKIGGDLKLRVKELLGIK
jgi:serine/threonine protein kinase